MTIPTRPDEPPGDVGSQPEGAKPISGILLLDKPPTLSSNAALQRVRRLYDRVKAGHTGTLDPLASGLLPICLGEATKFTGQLLSSDKTYRACLRLGWRSSTGDAEGELTEVAAPDFDDVRLNAAVASLSGEIEQVPPMYSALKRNGQPLYALARKGIRVERQARRIRILNLEARRLDEQTLEILVTCSKGTYIRTLAEDLGEQLGCGAYLTALRRLAIGPFDLSDAVRLDELEQMPAPRRAGVLKPIDLLLGDMTMVRLSMAESRRLLNGLLVRGLENVAPGSVRVYSEQGDFLGLGEVLDDGSLKPKRLISSTRLSL